MKLTKICKSPFSVIVLFLLTCASLFGQAISGDITGSIFDPSGAAIPAATVVATNEETGVESTTDTNSAGFYRFSNLPIGSYTLTASSSGFAKATVKNIKTVLSSVITENLTLQVGTTSSNVEVTAASVAIDTTTAQLQTTFETKQVLELPDTAKGTGIWNLSLVGAGVASQGGIGQGVGPSVAGLRPENNTFNLDGVSNNNYYSTGPLVVTSNEAIEEVSLLQNQYSAEFGLGSGGVFNAIVKSGTNEVHGSIYEYLQNRNLNAVDALDWTQGLTSNPRFDNNRLGATIGGPIVKNKLFYFGNFEYNPIGQSSVPQAPVSAPTAAGYTALSSLAGVAKNNLAVMQKYLPAAATNDAGTTTVNGVTIPLGNVSFVNPTFQNNYNALVSIDYNVSEKDQVRGRWIYNKSEGLLAPANVPAFNVNSPNNNYMYSLSEFHNFSPTTQNEFRASFNRNYNKLGLPNINFPGLNVFPVITIDETNLTLGPTGPSGSVQNQLQAQDNLSKVWGRHTVKVGYHFTDIILTNYFIQRVLGNYEYSTLQQYLDDLTPDVLGERSAGPTSYPTGYLIHEAFANDDFRVSSNLTLNLGVRWEYVTTPIASRYQVLSAPASIPGGITFGNPKPSPNEWSPRVGFAYAPGKDSNWSIRGGFARAFALTYANLTSNSAPPYFQQTNDVDLSSNAPNFLAGGGLPGSPQPLPTDHLGALGLISSYTFGGKRPYALTWNFGVQHVFWKNYTFEARYVGTHGVHLWNQSRLNIASRVNANNYIPTFFTMPSAATFASLSKTLAQVKSYIVPGGTSARPYDIYAADGTQGNIVGYAPQGVSEYNGLALQLNRRFANNLNFIGAYTWSHNIDDATATNFSTYLTPRRAQDFFNMAAEKSSSALDHRQRFTFTSIYDWKPFHNSNWVMRNMIGNWNISGTYTYETPEYATVQSGLDSNLNNDSAGDRAIVNPAGAANVGSGVVGYNSLGQVASTSGSIVAYVAANPNARYVVAGSGALATGGRNTFPLKPTNNIDVSLTKRFSFHERFGFDIGGQFFNVLNHAQYTGGFPNDVAANGFINSRNDLIPNNALFGHFDQYYSSNSRTMQIVGRIRF